MSFESHKELMQALIDGKKIRNMGLYPDKYACINESGNIVDENGRESSLDFDHPEKYEFYIEPKKKKKITLYRYTTRYEEGDYSQSNWTNTRFEDIYSNKVKLVKTEVKEIDIEE